MITWGGRWALTGFHYVVPASSHSCSHLANALIVCCRTISIMNKEREVPRERREEVRER